MATLNLTKNLRNFLIVGPPRWFGLVWKIIHPIMGIWILFNIQGAELAQKVKLVKKREDLVEHVKDFSLLPVSLGGKADIAALMQEFIQWRRQEEV
jgi:hypothetical protein